MKIVCLTVVLSVLCGMTYAHSFVATKDTFIRNGTSKTNGVQNSNYEFGNSETLRLKNASGANYDRIIYLGFDISSFSSPVTGATLKLRETAADAGVVNYSLYAISAANYKAGGGDWSESTLNYNNAAYTYANLADIITDGGVLVDTGTFAANTTDYSITSAALTSFASANDVFTLILTTTSDDERTFHTKESTLVGALAPTLEVIPEPATLGLVAAFGGGILFIRRTFVI